MRLAINVYVRILILILFTVIGPNSHGSICKGLFSSGDYLMRGLERHIEEPELLRITKDLDPVALVEQAYLNLYDPKDPPKKSFIEREDGTRLLTMPYTSLNGEKLVKEMVIDPKVKPGITGRVRFSKNGISSDTNLDATWITGYRTAAKSVLMMLQMFGKDDSFRVRVHGGSVQAEHHIRMIRSYFSQATIEVVGRNSKSKDWLLSKGFKEGNRLSYVVQGREVPADVVIGITNSVEPILNQRNLHGAQLVIAIGSSSGKVSEIETSLIKDYQILVDSLVSIAGKGELALPLEKGLISREQISEFKQLLLGSKTVDRDQSPVLFVSKGLIIEDYVVVKSIVENI